MISMEVRTIGHIWKEKVSIKSTSMIPFNSEQEGAEKSRIHARLITVNEWSHGSSTFDKQNKDIRLSLFIERKNFNLTRCPKKPDTLLSQYRKIKMHLSEADYLMLFSIS